MTAPRSIPPGRAGRLRLRHSLDVAQRGADLLDRKLSILTTEQQRLRAAEAAAERAWRERVREAETWLLRGVLLGGERALERAVPADLAEATIEWALVMGIRHPAAITCTPAARTMDEPAPGNTALARAERTYREALRAAADYAAARTAVRIVDAETARTRQRVRALRRHWIPRLADALAAVNLALEQAEHEDSVRRRWAAGER